MGIRIIADLVDNECIISAALLDPEGFTIERTSSDFKPKMMVELLDLHSEDKLVTLVGENSTVISSKIESGHHIVIQCPNGSNLGKARQRLAAACSAIPPFL
ncbi:MAG: hypothetical protein QF445_05330 [Candidatus Poseidoniaceae archaeon]|nr:hypothetical protein [Candidatus Poseidoniaceae archaeon]